MRLYRSIERADGCTVNIYYDESPENPVTSWDILGTMYCAHSRYNLGNVHCRDADDVLCRMCEDLLPQRMYDSRTVQDWINGDGDEAKVWALLHRHAIILPLYLYDHSNLSISTTPYSRYYSGQVGYYAVAKATARQEFKGKYIEKAKACMEGTVSVYDDYLQGDVYGYVVTDAEGNETDSCWGYYGDPKTSGLYDAAGLK